MTPNLSKVAWWSFVIGSGFALFASVVSVMPSFVGNDLRAAFEISRTDLGRLSSLYFYVSGPSLLIVGVALDRLGSTRCLLLAIAVCVVGILPLAVTHDFPLARIGRALSGLGGSFSFVGALWLVAHWFPQERFGLLSGAVNAIAMVGTAVASVLLDNLSRYMGWQSLTMVIVLLGLALLFTAFLRLRHPPHECDLGGRELAAALPRTLRIVAGSRATWQLGLVCMLFYMPATIYGMLWGDDQLMADHGFDSVLAQGLATSVLAGVAVGNVIAGGLSDRLDRRKEIIVAGTVLANASFAAAIYLPVDSPIVIGLALFLTGIFVGAQVLVYAIARLRFEREVVGTATAFISMIGAGAAAFFQPLVGYLLDRTDDNFHTALIVVPVALLAATIVSCLLKDPQRQA
jgi:MFS family permease